MGVASKKFYFKGGVQYTRDPNNSQRKFKVGLEGAEQFRKRDDLEIGKLSVEDDGILAYLEAANAGKATNPSIGGGDGFYYFDGTHFRKLGFGQGATRTCTAGNPIIPAAQRSLLMGMTCLPITAAGPVTVGTATTLPILPDGYPGQELTIVNIGANAITLTDFAGMAASNLKLISATLALAQHRGVRFVFMDNYAAGQRWRQVGPVTELLA